MDAKRSIHMNNLIQLILPQPEKQRTRLPTTHRILDPEMVA